MELRGDHVVSHQMTKSVIVNQELYQKRLQHLTVDIWPKIGTSGKALQNPKMPTGQDAHKCIFEGGLSNLGFPREFLETWGARDVKCISLGASTFPRKHESKENVWNAWGGDSLK